MQNVVPKVNPGFMADLVNTGISFNLLDVRSINEFKSGHAKGAVSFPMSNLNAETLEEQFGKKAGRDEPLYLICAAGFRAEQAASNLRAQGLEKVIVVNGGTDAWIKQGLPTKSKLSSFWTIDLSPQAQAELFFGALVLLFAIKGLFLHPAFVALVGFVGVLLVISSFNHRYSLARVFADLPWNRHLR